MNSVSKPKLEPLQVPWMLSPSVPEIAMNTKIRGCVVDAMVEFTGFLGVGTPLSEEYGAYHRIINTFESVMYARVFPENSASDDARISDYDWTDIPMFRDESGGFRGALKRNHAAWIESGICPSPSSYLVIGSDVVQMLPINPEEFKHFLFLGDDFYVEIVAKFWKWQMHSEPHTFNIRKIIQIPDP